MAEVLSTFLLQRGAAAPGFTLPDADAVPHSLADLRGANGLLVVFACNHCPFVVHLADAFGTFAAEAAELGVSTVAIMPNDVSRYPADGPDEMKQFAAEHGWDFPYLIDGTQDVAKAYGAACTPDFFLFDGKLRLFYTGQFDDTRPRGAREPHGGDLREALRKMLAGESGLERPYPSSGCNIKWKPGNEPQWMEIV
jgi:peroxiredoxin